MDGYVRFATHIVHCEGADGVYCSQRIDGGFLCYSAEELERLEGVLKESGIAYTVEPLQPDPALVAKAHGVKYSSRSEAIAHLTEDKEPESMIIPNLKAKLREKELEISQLRAEKDAQISQLKAEKDEEIGKLREEVGVQIGQLKAEKDKEISQLTSDLQVFKDTLVSKSLI